MISSPNQPRRQRIRPQSRSVELDEVLQSLRLVLEMEPDHIDGAIDLLDAAIDIDQPGKPARRLKRGNAG